MTKLARDARNCPITQSVASIADQLRICCEVATRKGSPETAFPIVVALQPC